MQPDMKTSLPISSVALSFNHPSLEVWTACIQDMCQQGKRQNSLALMFHVAEDLRVYRKDWKSSFPLYKSLFQDYIDDNDRRKALFMITELIIARHNEVKNVADSWLTKLCQLFNEQSFLLPIYSDDWNHYMMHRRFHQTLFILSLHALHVSSLSFQKETQQQIADAWIRWIFLTESSELVLQSLSSCWPFQDSVDTKEKEHWLVLVSKESCASCKSIDLIEKQRCLQIVDRCFVKKELLPLLT